MDNVYGIGNDGHDQDYLNDCGRSPFENQKWLTADYFPGKAERATDTETVHTVSINGNMGEVWGNHVQSATADRRMPTGKHHAQMVECRVAHAARRTPRDARRWTHRAWTDCNPRPVQSWQAFTCRPV